MELEFDSIEVQHTITIHRAKCPTCGHFIGTQTYHGSTNRGHATRVLRDHHQIIHNSPLPE